MRIHHLTAALLTLLPSLTSAYICISTMTITQTACTDDCVKVLMGATKTQLTDCGGCDLLATHTIQAPTASCKSCVNGAMSATFSHHLTTTIMACEESPSHAMQITRTREGEGKE